MTRTRIYEGVEIDWVAHDVRKFARLMMPDGNAPRFAWHQVEDTADKIDLEVLARALAFTSAFIQALDERG